MSPPIISEYSLRESNSLVRRRKKLSSHVDGAYTETKAIFLLLIVVHIYDILPDRSLLLLSMVSAYLRDSNAMEPLLLVSSLDEAATYYRKCDSCISAISMFFLLK